MIYIHKEKSALQVTQSSSNLYIYKCPVIIYVIAVYLYTYIQNQICIAGVVFIITYYYSNNNNKNINITSQVPYRISKQLLR